MLLTMAITGLGSLYSGLSNDITNFTVSRFVTGIGIGADLAVVNTYIGEMSPAARRASYTSLIFIMSALGAFVGIWLGLILTTEPTPFQFVATLHALNLGTGNDAVTPTIIAPSATLSNGSTVAFDPQNQWSRAGLAYNNGSLYMGIGSHCDNNSGGITGWLLRYSTSTLALPSSGRIMSMLMFIDCGPPPNWACMLFLTKRLR